MDNELQNLVAFLSAQGRARPQPQEAYGSMSVEPQQTGPPLRGGVTGPGGYSTPEAQAGGKTFEGYDQAIGNAPGYSPYRKVETPEVIAANDRAWEEKQRMWDAEEAMRQTAEEQSYAQSRLREGVGPKQLQDWQKYQDVMASGDSPNMRPQEQPQANPYQPKPQPSPFGTSMDNLRRNLAQFLKPFYGAAGQ